MYPVRLPSSDNETGKPTSKFADCMMSGKARQFEDKQKSFVNTRIFLVSG